jgi:LuxR family maltose regulon positive regulatory protein
MALYGVWRLRADDTMVRASINRRNAIAVIVAMNLIVGVPLTLTLVRLAHDGSSQAIVGDAGRRWANGAGWELTGVDIEAGKIVARFERPTPLPTTDELRLLEGGSNRLGRRPRGAAPTPDHRPRPLSATDDRSGSPLQARAPHALLVRFAFVPAQSVGLEDAEPRRSWTFAASKFHGPTLPERHVTRPSLRLRLEGDAPVCVVIGSPGAGKTKLLAEWYHAQTDGRACWVNVDEGDRDPARFWHALTAAVQQVAPGFAAASLDLLTLDESVDYEVLESFLHASDRLDPPVSVVLDDFHLAGAQVHQQMRFVLGRLTGGLRLLVGTRAEPEIGLHRLRLEGQVEELREADLRFETADAHELLHKLGVELLPDALAVVLERTEGWAAGLQLAALALRDTADSAGFVARLNGTHQVIAHYLWSEVFAAQDRDVQRFLVDTCVVDELSPSLAAALSPGNPVTLFDIEAASLLLRRADVGDQLFRFHQLLTDMLRFRLRTEHPAHEVQLHRRAARWYENHGDPVGAFRHNWRAGQRTTAMRSMDDAVLDVVFDGLPDMTQFERSLTDDDIRAAPGSALSFAAGLVIVGLAAEADRLSSRIRDTVTPQLSPAERQQLHAVRSSAALVLGDSRTAADLGELADSDISPARWSHIVRLGAAKGHTWEGEYDQAAIDLSVPLPVHAAIFERMERDGTAALLQLFQGHLHHSRATAAECLDAVEREGWEGTTADGMLARAVLGAVHLEQGDLARAEELLRSVADVPSNFRVPARVLAFVALARIRIGEGRFDAAQAAVADCYRLIRARPARCGILDHVRAQHFRNLLAAGQPGDALVVFDELDQGPRRQLLGVELALSRNRLDEAAQLLDQAASACMSGRDRLGHAIGRLRLAVAGSGDAAIAAADVFDLAAPQGWLFPLIEAGTDALLAVQAQARRARRDSYTDALMRLRPRAIPAVRQRGDPTTLTDRERIVLRYLATSMSYREMAAEMCVSSNTLKTHVKNINRKLGTASRIETIRRARELCCL